MANKPSPYEDLSWIQNDGIKAYTNPRPSDGIGKWEYFTGTFKQAVASSISGDTGSPFSNAKLGGLKSWQQSTVFGSDSRLKLVDNDGDTTSGYVTFTMANNWQGLFYVKTENNDFFQDNVKETWVESGWNDSDSFTEEFGEAVNELEIEGWPSVWIQDNSEYTDSRTVFGLDSTDYLSFDIDSESNDAAQSRIRIGGDDYLSNTATDDDIWITCAFLRRWNPTYEWPESDNPNPNPDPEPNPDPDPNNPCQTGYALNEFGICVLIPEPEPEECETGFEWNPLTLTCDPIYNAADDVSTFEMLLLLVGVSLVVYLAVKVV